MAGRTPINRKLSLDARRVATGLTVISSSELDDTKRSEAGQDLSVIFKENCSRLTHVSAQILSDRHVLAQQHCCAKRQGQQHHVKRDRLKLAAPD